MDVVLYDGSQSNPDENLAIALREYESVLSADERLQLRNQGVPDATAAIALTTRIDNESGDGRRHCMGTRLTTMLESAQRFSTVVGMFVSSHPEIAALCWGGIKFALLVRDPCQRALSSSFKRGFYPHDPLLRCAISLFRHFRGHSPSNQTCRKVFYLCLCYCQGAVSRCFKCCMVRSRC